MSDELLPKNQEAAAQLLAHGGIEKQEIAKQLQISRQTLWNWENKDEKFKNRVDFLKREFESFGVELINSKFIQAVNGYWDLIRQTENDRVAADGYRYFIDRKLGKPTSKHEIEAGIKETNKVDEDVLESEFEEWSQGEED